VRLSFWCAHTMWMPLMRVSGFAVRQTRFLVAAGG
jgi:hypothetical protein